MNKYELFYCDGYGAATRGMERDTNYIVKFTAADDFQAFVKVYLRLYSNTLDMLDYRDYRDFDLDKHSDYKLCLDAICEALDVDELSIDMIKEEFDSTDVGSGAAFIYYIKKGNKIIYEFADYDSLQFEDDEICVEEM